MDFNSVIQSIWESDELVGDLHAICDCGGRLAGTESELQARRLVLSRLKELSPDVTESSWQVSGRRPESSHLQILGLEKASLASVPLVMSPPTASAEQEFEVVDLGRGAPAEFAAAEGLIPSRAVLVQHEFPFSTGHIHRRRKYELARELGAGAFIIANNTAATGPVTGGIGLGDDKDIPAIGVSREVGEILSLRSATAPVRVRLTVKASDSTWPATNLSIEFPGRTTDVVVVCGHYDGHALAESALDNASGVAVALAIGRHLGPLAGNLRRGLRLVFFTVEEWGLQGSRHYLDELDAAERQRIAFAINLDTVVGHPRLFALTSESNEVESILRKVSGRNGLPITPVRPLIRNSDHYNFAQVGIPALRLIAGYEEPFTSLTRLILTREDTRDKVDTGQLRAAAITAARLAYEACTAI